jgi:hypothetical protein
MITIIERFLKLPIADAQIHEMYIRKGEFCLKGEDWQEKNFVLLFTDVVGVEAYGIEDEDLSHVTANITDEFIERACELANEENVGLICFCLYSAWTDSPKLRVVAKGFQFDSVIDN